MLNKKFTLLIFILCFLLRFTDIIGMVPHPTDTTAETTSAGIFFNLIDTNSTNNINKLKEEILKLIKDLKIKNNITENEINPIQQKWNTLKSLHISNYMEGLINIFGNGKPWKDLEDFKSRK